VPTLSDLHKYTTRNNKYGKMIRSTADFCSYFDSNHFYYCRVVKKGNVGYYSSLGTHLNWHEFHYCNTQDMASWPIIRNPENLNSSIIILKNTSDPTFKKALETAWNKFGVNLSINIQKKIPDGIECFGIGLKSNHIKAEQFLLNHLPLIDKFIEYFVENNKELIHLSHEHQVDISTVIGDRYYERQEEYPIKRVNNNLLKQLGLAAVELLTPREIDVIKYTAGGYPAIHIAKQLGLSKRTVEHYIVNIKSKLDCHSKVCLINKSKEIYSIL
jgi:DNA-binding CsgD family transcriptional regulator